MNSTSVPSTPVHVALPNNRWQPLFRNREYIALAILILVVSVINIAWIRQDARPIPHSDAQLYLMTTFRFMDAVKQQGIAHLWQSVSNLSFQGRPPFYQLLSVPFIWLLGRSVDGGLAVNILFEAVLLLSTYGMGKVAKNGRAGLLAALIVATYPPVIQFSRFYMPHFALIACVALSMWLLLLLLKTRSVKVAWLFGASLGFGVLVSHYSLFYLPIPAVICGVYMLLFQTSPRWPPSLKGTPGWLLTKLRDPFTLRGLLPAALVAGGLVASWYLTQGRGLLLTVERLASWEQVKTLGFNVPSSLLFWWYALTTPGVISYVFAVLLAIGLVGGIVKRRFSSSVLVITFMTVYCVLSLLTWRAWYVFVAALPVAAALTAVWIVDIRNKLLATVLAAVCVVAAIFNFSVVMWGVQPWSRPVAIALGAPLDSVTCSQPLNLAFCPNPASDQNWSRRAIDPILNSIQGDPECQNRACSLMVIPYGPYFRSTTFAYYAFQDFPGKNINTADPSTGWWRGAFNLPGLLKSEYLVYIPQEVPVEQGQLIRFLQSPPADFADGHRKVASVALPDGRTASLLKRIKPLTVEETETTIAALGFPEESMFQQFALLAEVHTQNGEWDKALEFYGQALQQSPYVDAERARLLVEMGKLHRQLGHEAQAREIYAQAIAVDPSYSAASIRLAQLEQESGDPDAAERILQAALRQPLDHPAVVNIQLGNLYRDTGRLADALVEYQKAVKADPVSAWPHTALGYAYHKVGQMDKAMAEYTQAIRLVPNYFEAYIRLGDAYRTVGRADEAVQTYLKAVQIAPDSGWAHTALGNAYRAQDNTEMALAEYQEAVRVEPGYTQAYVAMGQVYEGKGQEDEALRQYQRAAEVVPRDLAAYLALGRLYLTRGQPEEAAAVYRKALQLNPDAGSVSIALASIFLEQGKVDDAVAVYTGALAASPTSDQVSLALVDAVMGQRGTAGAIDEFNRLAENRPTALAGYLGLAKAYQAQGIATSEQADRVIRACQEALQISPGSATAHKLLGDTYLQVQAWDKAIAQYRALVDLNPVEARYHAYLAQAYLEQGQTATALAEYQAALKLAPDEAWPRWELGKAYQKSNDLDRAIGAFSQAVQIAPSEAAYHYALATAQQQQGLLDGAILAYEQAVKLRPDSPWYHLALGGAYEQQGALERAVVEYQLALNLNPGHQGTRTALARVRALQGSAKP